MYAAKRKWGQHWLASEVLAADLVHLIGLQPGESVLEIGPGTGRMTGAMLSAGAKVVAVEVDPDCCDALTAAGDPDRLLVIEADLLDADDEIPWERGPFRVVGNLPYNVSSPILRWTVRQRRHLVDAHYMLQLEVARRIASPPGSKEYGLLSVLVQAAFEPAVLRQLSPDDFRPRPRVDSGFVRLSPRADDELAGDLESWIGAAEAAFGHRRKQLANALRLAGHDREQVEEALASAGIRGDLRAENLTVESFARLGRALGRP